MFVRVLSITAGALLATAIVATTIYFCWLGLAGLLNDNSSLDSLNGRFQACGIHVRQSPGLVAYDLDAIFKQGFDCDNPEDICLLDCLRSGGASEYSGGCYTLCQAMDIDS